MPKLYFKSMAPGRYSVPRNWDAPHCGKEVMVKDNNIPISFHTGSGFFLLGRIERVGGSDGLIF